MPNSQYDVVIIGTGAGGAKSACLQLRHLRCSLMTNASVERVGKLDRDALRGVRWLSHRDSRSRFSSSPPDKRSAQWHQAGGKLFLGIDHTAIVISNTDANLGFYRDVLGLQIVGESESYGPEREHLNNVFGARLRIRSLRAASGPGVKFLEYQAPRDGRPNPTDEKPTTSSTGKPGLWGPAWRKPPRSSRNSGRLSFRPESWNSAAQIVSSRSRSWCAIRTGMPSSSCNVSWSD